MGKVVGSQTIQLEERWMRVDITKNKSGGNTAALTSQIGYYDADGVWHKQREAYRTLEGDALKYVMGLTGSQMGLAADPNTFTQVDAVAYGVLGGQIPTDSTLTVTVTDEAGNPITSGTIEVLDGGNVAAVGQPGVAFSAPLLLQGEVRVESEGYVTHLEPAQLLAGPVAFTVALTKKAVV